MTNETLHVSLDDLRLSFDTLLRHIVTSTGEEAVVLDRDYFWSIPGDELYDVTREPANLTVGQLFESWQHVKELAAHPDRAVAHHLVWLADILRAGGQELPL